MTVMFLLLSIVDASRLGSFLLYCRLSSDPKEDQCRGVRIKPFTARLSYLSSSFIPHFLCQSRVLDRHTYQESEIRTIRVLRKLIQVSIILRIHKRNGESTVQEVYVFARRDQDGRFLELQEVTLMTEGSERDRGLGQA